MCRLPAYRLRATPLNAPWKTILVHCLHLSFCVVCFPHYIWRRSTHTHTQRQIDSFRLALHTPAHQAKRTRTHKILSFIFLWAGKQFNILTGFLPSTAWVSVCSMPLFPPPRTSAFSSSFQPPPIPQLSFYPGSHMHPNVSATHIRHGKDIAYFGFKLKASRHLMTAFLACAPTSASRVYV